MPATLGPGEPLWAPNSNAGSVAATAASSAVTTTQKKQADQQYDPNNIPDYGGVYGMAQADAETAFQKAQQAIQAKRSGIYQQYGYSNDGSVNGNNPLGIYQQSKYADAQDVMGAENDALDRGIGVSGLGAQGIEAAQHGADLRDAGMAGSYLSALQGNDQEAQDAIAQRSAALLSARQNQILTAIQNGWFTPGDTSEDGGSGSTDTSSQPPAGSNAASTAARIAAASAAAFKAAGGKSSPAAALAARSAGLNAKYGLGTPKPAPKKDTRPKTVVYKGRH